MNTRNRKVFESREDEPNQNVNRVSSTPHQYTSYVNAQDETNVPEYFNLPNLIRVSKGGMLGCTVLSA